MTNPSETRDSELVARARELAGAIEFSPIGARKMLRRLADTIDRLTSTGEAGPAGWRWKDWYPKDVPWSEKHWNYSDTGPDEDGKECLWEPLYTHASPREGHVEVPVESEMRTLAEHCAGLMNKLSDRGHTGLMQECPLCQAYIGAARLLAHETDTPMPDEVVIWDRRLEAAALPHNQGETKP